MTTTDNKNSRVADASIEPMFTERWSSRSFTDESLSEDEIASLFEAARWAPSSGNAQPWLFVYATNGPKREQFNALLSDGNKAYAPSAPLMILVFARSVNDDGNKIRTAHFDTGAAWMSLALQANRMGLNTRGMGGIDLDAAYDVAGVPRDKFETICAIVVGHRGSDDDIPERMVKQNLANGRNPVSGAAFKDGYTG